MKGRANNADGWNEKAIFAVPIERKCVYAGGAGRVEEGIKAFELSIVIISK